MRLPQKHLRKSAIVALAALLLPLGACEEETAMSMVDENLRRVEAEGILYGVKSYLRTNGIRSGVVFADSAYQFPDSSQTRLYAMEMTLYHDDGRDRARIEADSAVLHQRTEELTAWGHVVAQVLDQGMTIESSELQYDPSASQIWSDSATTITQDDGSTTRGTSFRSDLMFQNWELQNPVGVIPTEGGVGN
jgi:LPS export ABC transporter protein LptC